jgi:predicted MFS family arabinose efflux permease
MTGYQGSIVTQAITFVVDEFGSTKAQQGRALSAIRADVFLTLIFVWIADRIGRRKVLLTCALISPVLTAATALTPSLSTFVMVQIVARSFVTATAVLLAVVGVEQMAAKNRGWASSILVGAAAAGTVTLLIPVSFAGRSPGFWRVMFLPPLLGIFAVIIAARYIHETDRFHHLEVKRQHGDAHIGYTPHIKRLLVIAVWLILMGVFSTPARQFQNDFLREEHGFTPGRLGLFGLITNIPGLFGVFLGGALSDRTSRRRTVGVGLLGYGIFTGAMFLSGGKTLWMLAMASSLCGAIALPGLAILVPELFPTGLRSLASGFSTWFNRIGSAIGLLAAGYFADRFKVGPTLAVMSISIVLGSLVVMFAVPEPAGKELETLNPEDR